MSGIFDGGGGAFLGLGGTGHMTPEQMQRALLGQSNAWNIENARRQAEMSVQMTDEQRAQLWNRYAFNAAPRPEPGIHWRREGGKRWTATIYR